MSLDVIRAQEADVGVLSQVIADAFFDLPPSPWLISEVAARRAIFPGYFRIFVEQTLAGGVVQTTAERDAVALWLRVDSSAGATGPAGSDQDSGAAVEYGRRLVAATSPWSERFLLFDSALERSHPAGAAHHHLAILAVRPDRQGRGIGTAMLEAYHQIIDEVAEAAYLEASDQRNRQLYSRHGYADRGEPIQLPGGPCMYPMWRAARISARVSEN